MEVMHVVSGAYVVDGRVLMGLRRQSKLRPGLWEMPGGKIEKGETPQQALAREWQEELHVAIEVGEFITVATFEVEVPIVVSLYAVASAGLIIPTAEMDHEDLRWLDPEKAVKHYPCSPGVYVHFGALRRWIERKR